MTVGVFRERKPDENRVAVTPAGVRELTRRGHSVYIEEAAGLQSGFSNEAYADQGAVLLPTQREVAKRADLIVGVKEPQRDQIGLLEERHTLFTFLHLGAAGPLTRDLLATGATCIAYETITDTSRRLPLLAPMSEVAGRLSAQAGAFMLQRPLGGRGVLPGGVPGVGRATALVIGGGTVGYSAAAVASGLGFRVVIVDRSLERLRELERIFGARVNLIHASSLALEQLLPGADLVIGAVLVPGARAPRVLTRDQLRLIPERGVLVDVSIDQGGCFEGSRATSHSDPTYELHGRLFYCVANMPAAVPITSTAALTNATLPYVQRVARHGVASLAARDRAIRSGINVARGNVTNSAVADALRMDWVDPRDALEARLASPAGIDTGGR